MPDVSGVTVVTNARAFYTPRAAADASSVRHSLRPLIEEGGTNGKTSRETGGEIAKACLQPCCLRIFTGARPNALHLSPPVGEVGSHRDPGEGLCSIEGPEPLTPALSHKGRGSPPPLRRHRLFDLHRRWSSPGSTGDPVFRGTSDGIDKPQRTGYPQEHVIGLAAGETRWRGMTAVAALRVSRSGIMHLMTSSPSHPATSRASARRTYLHLATLAGRGRRRSDSDDSG
jgi:hypothetical protein